MANIEVPSDVFNAKKTDYASIKPFFNEEAGLFDTIHKPHSDLWTLYKTLKNLDWDENDFVFTSCNHQFKTCPAPIYRRMIKTLAWQWETDSIAARILPAVIANIDPASDLFAGYCRIIDNENVHSATYSEIVRNSFDDPNEALKEILEVKESLSRLSVVGNVFSTAKRTALRYALDRGRYTQQTYNDIFMFFVALYCVERIQFMGSFAITFGICQSTGLFQPIGAAVQKIAQDEWEIHVQYQMGVLKHALKTKEGQIAYQQCRPTIIKMLNEIVSSEVSWNDYTFADDGELVGLDQKSVDSWIYFNATDAANFLSVADDVDYPVIKNNPLRFMENWLNISSIQRSPQEENKGDYKVNVMLDTSAGVVFEDDF